MKNSAWSQDISNRAKEFSKILQKIKPLYGLEPITPHYEEILEAFILSLVDIGRYCKDNHIDAKSIDSVKLLSFSIPYLLSIRLYSLRIDMYMHACIIMIHGNKNVPEYEKLINTNQVARRLCLKFPTQYLIVYGYLKGYQESLELNT